MLIALWIINALLALAFLGAGINKLTKSRSALIDGGMAWAADMSDGAVKLIASLEVLGAIGLILPLATGIVPLLTPIAATGLALLMLGATLVHLRRREAFLPALILAALSIVSAVLGFIALT